MQCTWPTLARLAFRGFARPWPLASPPRTAPTCLKTPSMPWAADMSTLRPNIPFSSMPQRRAHSTATKLNPSPISFFSTTQSLSTTHSEFFTSNTTESGLEEQPTHTHAQVGRIAAQAVRLSVHKGNLADAYLIVRSIYHARFSASNTDTRGTSLPPLAVQRFLGGIEATAIPFDRLVSPRLPAHALLHGLVRMGEYQQAAQLARQMMESGTRMRCTSLDAVMQGLRDISSASPPRLFAPIISLKAIDATLFRPHMKANANITESALTILQAARQSGQRSTHRMYRYLMTLCIINGEIILASLLFGVLLRDWQAREQQAKLMHSAVALSTHIAGKDVDTPRPDLGDLKRMLSFVNWNLAAPQTDESFRLAFSASLQALANLADAMDRRQIPINLEPLITALYKCPRTQELVWISGDNGAPPRRVDAYGYFHAVLDRLILSLDNKKGATDPEGDQEVERKRDQIKKPDKCESLNPWAFNALLHYTLRHHHSVDRARVVLMRMLQHPEADLPTNADVTRNILERARRDFLPGTIDKLMKSVGLIPQSPAESLLALARVSDQKLDPYALSTHILTLTRSKQIPIIISALRDLLPGLYPPAAPQGTPTSVALNMAAAHREESLSRAVLLGPVVFGALLNALRKEGKTGLAERVFLYALEAEEKSFIPEVKQREGRGKETLVVRPWCLPVHVYTTMVQVYDRERKGRVDSPFALGWGLTSDGRPIVYGKNTEPIRRTDLSRRMIVFMYRSMMDASEVIKQRLEALRAHAAATGNMVIEIKSGTLTPPEPDKWFFESLVDIFAKMPNDPVFPAAVKAMEGRGFRVAQSVEQKLKEVWGDEAWDVIVKAREDFPDDMVERDRRPVGMERVGKRRGVGMGVPARMGWKKWNLDTKSLKEKEKKNQEWSKLLSFCPTRDGHAA